jgi:tRNA pseudouridine55 synthase
MNGVLVVDKPTGPTSHDVVGRVRRALGTRRVGHTGTLDPLASGVLPLVVGQATRLAQFLVSDEKEYLADVRFGFSTTTYDSAGTPDSAEAAAVDLAPLDAALDELRGTYLQMPPAFSAKKVDGTRAYELARAGKTPELRAVEVTVHLLEVVERGERSARLRVGCTSGFYVRTLAHELGRRLGCGAHLSGLRRTRAGSFTIGEAVPLSAIEADGAGAAARMIALEDLLPSLPSVVLTDQGAKRARHGNRITGDDISSGEVPAGPNVRLLDEGGHLLAIASEAPGRALHPVVVLV